MQIGDKRRERLEELLALDIDQIYAEVARDDPANAGKLFSPEEASNQGKSLFARLNAPIRKAICEDWNYCERRHNPELQDNVALASVIADTLLATMGGIPLPAVALSALLVKKGLTRYCKCNAAD